MITCPDDVTMTLWWERWWDRRADAWWIMIWLFC